MTESRRRFLMWVVVPGLLAGALIGLPFILPADITPIAFLLPILVIGAVGLHHGFSLDPRYLVKWASAHGVNVTPENEAVVRRYLLRGRRIRAVGAVLGYLSFSIADFYLRFESAPVGSLSATFAGYLLGAAAAEIWAMRPERGSVRIASLAPRLVSDYVPRWAVASVRMFSSATAVAAASWPILPEIPIRLRDAERSPDVASIVVWSAGAVVLALFVEATGRRIVRRPQPATSPEMVALDDAIRSTALHGLYGAGLALILGALSQTAHELQPILRLGSPLRNAFGIVAIAAWISAVFVWLRLGVDQPWVVRRDRRPDPVAA